MDIQAPLADPTRRIYPTLVCSLTWTGEKTGCKLNLTLKELNDLILLRDLLSEILDLLGSPYQLQTIML